MKKLRFTVSKFMLEVLEEDKENFNLELGAIGNRLFSYYANKEVYRTPDKIEKGEIIQFNLSKQNEEMYIKVLQEHDILVEAEYMRNVLFTYINNPRYLREEMLFSENFQLVREAIEQKKKINVKYHKKVKTVDPYFLKVADRENRSYLFGYSEEEEDYRCYRISEIENIMISKKEREERDIEYIQGVYENFDPFHSYGKYVKVQFTNRGKELLKRAIQNRPKVLKREENIYQFQCDEKLAQIYFSQFLKEVEILEPKTLRKWFQEEFQKCCEVYK